MKSKTLVLVSLLAVVMDAFQVQPCWGVRDEEILTPLTRSLDFLQQQAPAHDKPFPLRIEWLSQEGFSTRLEPTSLHVARYLLGKDAFGQQIHPITEDGISGVYFFSIEGASRFYCKGTGKSLDPFEAVVRSCYHELFGGENLTAPSAYISSFGRAGTVQATERFFRDFPRIQISLGVEGISLETFLKDEASVVDAAQVQRLEHAQEDVKQRVEQWLARNAQRQEEWIGPTRWRDNFYRSAGAHILMALLLPTGDAKADNFIVNLQIGQIVNIDTEETPRSSFELESSGHHYLKFKNIFFCCEDLMRDNVHPELRGLLLRNQIVENLSAWRTRAAVPYIRRFIQECADPGYRACIEKYFLREENPEILHNLRKLQEGLRNPDIISYAQLLQYMYPLEAQAYQEYVRYARKHLQFCELNDEIHPRTKTLSLLALDDIYAQPPRLSERRDLIRVNGVRYGVNANENDIADRSVRHKFSIQRILGRRLDETFDGWHDAEMPRQYLETAHPTNIPFIDITREILVQKIREIRAQRDQGEIGSGAVLQIHSFASDADIHGDITSPIDELITDPFVHIDVMRFQGGPNQLLRLGRVFYRKTQDATDVNLREELPHPSVGVRQPAQAIRNLQNDFKNRAVACWEKGVNILCIFDATARVHRKRIGVQNPRDFFQSLYAAALDRNDEDAQDIYHASLNGRISKPLQHGKFAKENPGPLDKVWAYFKGGY